MPFPLPRIKSLKSLKRSHKTIGGAFYVGHGKTKFFSMPQWKMSVIGVILGGIFLWALTAFIWLMLLVDAKQSVHERLAQSRFELFDYLAMTERLFESTYRSEEPALGTQGTQGELVPALTEEVAAPVVPEKQAQIAVQALQFKQVPRGLEVSFELHNLDKSTRLRGNLWLAAKVGQPTRWVTYPDGVPFDSQSLRLIQPKQGRGITVKNFSQYQLFLAGDFFQGVFLGIADLDGNLVFQQELASPPQSGEGNS